MGKQKPAIWFGAINNIIFYERDGIPCLRSMPAKVRQTRATKASAALFGRAVRLATQLRHGLQPILPRLPEANGKGVMYRFNDAVLQWFRQENPGVNTVADKLPFIDGFEFNPGSELVARLKVKPVIGWSSPGKVIITIPALDPTISIAAPAWTETVHWKILAVRATLEERAHLTGAYSTEMDMDYVKGMVAKQDIELSIAPKVGQITVVAISLRYAVRKSKELVGDKRWLPGGVVGAKCGG